MVYPVLLVFGSHVLYVIQRSLVSFLCQTVCHLIRPCPRLCVFAYEYFNFSWEDYQPIRKTISKGWTTPDFQNTPSATNLEEEEIVDAPGNDGNASMPEQVKRPSPCRKKMMMLMMMMTSSY
jgi:hypothetical protein